MPAGAGPCRNWDPVTCGKHQEKVLKSQACQQRPTGAEIGTLGPVGSIRVKKFLVCQQGPIGAEIGTLGPWGRLRVLIFD